MITELASEMFRNLESKYFEVAYNFAGYFEAEKAAKSYRKELRNEWFNLTREMSDETALKVMAEKYGYTLPKPRANHGGNDVEKPGPKCWAKYLVQEFNDYIYKKIEDSLHGEKLEHNKKRQLKKALEKAREFLDVSVPYWNEQRHGKYVSKEAVDYMADYCSYYLNRFNSLLLAA